MATDCNAEAHANFPGILISGGAGAKTSVEVFDPASGHHCVLPSLPDARYAHTSEGLDLCGGVHTLTTCITFSFGQWGTSHAWTNEEGNIISFGGYESPSSTETITHGEYKGVPGFRMKYKTR